MFSLAEFRLADSFATLELRMSPLTAKETSGVRNCAGNLRHQNRGSQRLTLARSKESFTQLPILSSL